MAPMVKRIAAASAALVLVACGNRGPVSDNRGPAELAAALSDEPELAVALAITRAALARAGIDSGTGDEVLVEGEAPRTGGYILPRQALNLALEARDRSNPGRLSVNELGELLRELGFPFAPGATPGEHLLTLLRGWTEAAAAHPDDPLAFHPLFIREMRLARLPSVDLMADTVAPEDVHLTLLELELFTAAFDRLYPRQTVTAASFLPRFWPMVAVQASPCERFKQWMAANVDGAKEDVVSGVVTSTAVGQILDKLVEKAAGEGVSKGVGAVLNAVSIAATLQKTAAYFSNAMIEVHPSATEVHKPLGEGAKTRVEFTARLALNPAEVETYERELRATSAAVRACVRQLGFPDYTTLADMVKDSENWRVNWRLYTDPKHAHWNNENFYLPGQQDMLLRRASATSIETLPFVTEVLHETKHEGQEAEAYMTAVARLESDNAFDAIKTILTPRFDPVSLGAGIVDLLSGWARNVINPTAMSTVRITYHRPPLHLRLTFEELKRGGGGLGRCAVGQVWEGRVDREAGGYAGQMTLMSRSFVCNDKTEAGQFLKEKRGAGMRCFHQHVPDAHPSVFRHYADVRGEALRGDTVRFVLSRTQRPPQDATCQAMDRDVGEWGLLQLPPAPYPQDEGEVVEVKTPDGVMRVERVPPASTR